MFPFSYEFNYIATSVGTFASYDDFGIKDWIKPKNLIAVGMIESAVRQGKLSTTGRYRLDLNRKGTKVQAKLTRLI